MKIRYFLMLLIIGIMFFSFKVNADNDTKTSTIFYIDYNNETKLLDVYYNLINDDDEQYMRKIRYYVGNGTIYDYIDGSIGDKALLNNKSITTEFYTDDISCLDVTSTKLYNLMDNISDNLNDCFQTKKTNGELSDALSSCDNSKNEVCRQKLSELNNLTTQYSTLKSERDGFQRDSSDWQTKYTTADARVKDLEGGRWLYIVLGGGGVALIGGLWWNGKYGGAKSKHRGDYEPPESRPLPNRTQELYPRDYPSQSTPSYNQQQPMQFPKVNIPENLKNIGGK